jgi:hypothetical protein
MPEQPETIKYPSLTDGKRYLGQCDYRYIENNIHYRITYELWDLGKGLIYNKLVYGSKVVEDVKV